MAKKKNSIKKEKIIEVLQQIPEKDLRSFLEKIICGPVVKARFLKEFDAYFINEKSADVYIEQIIGVFYDLLSGLEELFHNFPSRSLFLTVIVLITHHNYALIFNIMSLIIKNF